MKLFKKLVFNAKSKPRNLPNVPGFSLIELLVTISIIGILAGIALVSFTGAQMQARDSERKTDISQYQAYLETYANARVGFYPIYISSTSLVTVCNTDLDAPTCPEDQTAGQTYRYISNSQGTKYVVWATLEGSGQYWTGCSNGRIGQVASQSTNGDCPVADITSTPTPAATATNTPTPTATPTPTPTPTPGPGGLIANAGFESGSSPWNGISGGASIVTTQFHTGTSSLQIVQPGSGSTRVYQRVNVVAGQNYTASGWIKSNATDRAAQISISWRDSSDAPISLVIVGGQQGTVNWTFYSIGAQAPVGAVYARFNLDQIWGAGGSAWFDDLVLQ